MESGDMVVHIKHEPDWSGMATISWTGTGGHPQSAWVQASYLWGSADSTRYAISNDENEELWERVIRAMPAPIALRAVSLASRGRAEYEAGLVISRPSSKDDDADAPGFKQAHTPAFLFNKDLATITSRGPRKQAIPIPLGWIDNVAIALRPTDDGAADTEGKRKPWRGHLLIDIGAPDLKPCTCATRVSHELETPEKKDHQFHEYDCPARDSFPKIGRFTITRERVHELAEAMIAAATDGVARRFE